MSAEFVFLNDLRCAPCPVDGSDSQLGTGNVVTKRHKRPDSRNYHAAVHHVWFKNIYCEEAGQCLMH